MAWSPLAMRTAGRGVGVGVGVGVTVGMGVCVAVGLAVGVDVGPIMGSPEDVWQANMVNANKAANKRKVFFMLATITQPETGVNKTFVYSSNKPLTKRRLRVKL